MGRFCEAHCFRYRQTQKFETKPCSPPATPLHGLRLSRLSSFSATSRVARCGCRVPCWCARNEAEMAPKDDKAPVATLVDVEKWPSISGEAAERDFLYVVEVFCKWCGPSEAIISTFRRVLMDYAKRKLRFVQIEATEEIPELARFTTVSKPTFLFFLNGELCETCEGVNAPLIEKFIAGLTPDGLLEADDEGGGEEDED
jgi:thiol-disulfide isomerase/thioredoxin